MYRARWCKSKEKEAGEKLRRKKARYGKEGHGKQVQDRKEH